MNSVLCQEFLQIRDMLGDDLERLGGGADFNYWGDGTDWWVCR